ATAGPAPTPHRRRYAPETPVGARPGEKARGAVPERGRSAQCPAIDIAGDALHVLGIFITPWRCHLEQDRELSWHHQVAGRGRCEYEPPAAFTLLERELLRQCAAPRQAEYVHLRMPQLIEQLRAQPRQRRWTVRQPGRRGAAHTGHLEA